MSDKKKVAIIGSGPSAMMLAATLDESLFDVIIYEKNYAPGRKFLVAGNGGFNLTHADSPDELIKNYIPAGFLDKAIYSFSSKDLCLWLENLGIRTFTGTSKRIFPVKGIKPVEVLNAVLRHLKGKHTSILTQHQWIGWNRDSKPLFLTKSEQILIEADLTIFALGGASWARTGTDGKWASLFKEKNILTEPFMPSNCEFRVEWETSFIKKNEGRWLKNIGLKYESLIKQGELVITQTGLQGSPLYALSAPLRNKLGSGANTVVYLDLKPAFTVNHVIELLSQPEQSITDRLKYRLKLGPTQIDLIKSVLNKDEFMNMILLANIIKSLPVTISGMADLDEAISTSGGINLNETDEYFELKKLKNQFAIGEMLDWDAPTGGYLLQACFSMGHFLGETLNKRFKAGES